MLLFDAKNCFNKVTTCFLIEYFRQTFKYKIMWQKLT